MHTTSFMRCCCARGVRVVQLYTRAAAAQLAGDPRLQLLARRYTSSGGEGALARVLSQEGFNRSQRTSLLARTDLEEEDLCEGNLARVLAALHACGVQRPCALVVAEPSVLVRPDLLALTMALRQMFSPRQCDLLLRRYPNQILGANDQELRGVRDLCFYAGEIMGFHKNVIARSALFRMRIAELRARHVFLERAGVFTARPKLTESLQGALLGNILARKAAHFLERNVGSRITVEEYRVFCRAHQLEIEAEEMANAEDSDTYSDSDGGSDGDSDSDSDGGSDGDSDG